MRKPLLAALLALLAAAAWSDPTTCGPRSTRRRLAPQRPGRQDLANTAWWEQFGDPVLNDLVATALRENKDLMIAAARIEEFAGNYGFVRSGLFPQVGAGYEASRQRDISAVVIGAGAPATLQQLQCVLNASGKSTSGAASAARPKRRARSCWPAKKGRRA
jgi:multidrug efflux system outer membrane protein